MKITFLSHSCFLFETGSHTLIIDPFLTGNPLAQVKQEDIRCDYVLVTHGHQDSHPGDAVEIAKRNDATVITSFEVADWIGPARAAKAHPLGLGGGYDFPLRPIKADHRVPLRRRAELEGGFNYMGVSRRHADPDGGQDNLSRRRYGADAGDATPGQQRNKIDVAMLPIGDNFTMGPEDAVAAAEFLEARAHAADALRYLPAHQAGPEGICRHAGSKRPERLAAPKIGENDHASDSIQAMKSGDPSRERQSPSGGGRE